MQHTIPAQLTRINLQLRRTHVHRLAVLADKIAKRKGRDVRLGEALEATLTAGFAWEDHDLLDLVLPDKVAGHWLQAEPVYRNGGMAAFLRRKGLANAPDREKL